MIARTGEFLPTICEVSCQPGTDSNSGHVAKMLEGKQGETEKNERIARQSQAPFTLYISGSLQGSWLRVATHELRQKTKIVSLEIKGCKIETIWHHALCNITLAELVTVTFCEDGKIADSISFFPLRLRTGLVLRGFGANFYDLA